MARYKPTVAAAICERLARGEPLSEICGARRGKDIPSITAVYRWIQERPRFAREYALAREAQADSILEQMLVIADAKRVAVKYRDAARDKLKIDTRKWVAAKLAPKRYGDKPVTASDEPERAKVLRFPDDNARAARIAAILEEARLTNDAGES